MAECFFSFKIGRLYVQLQTNWIFIVQWAPGGRGMKKWIFWNLNWKAKWKGRVYLRNIAFLHGVKYRWWESNETIRKRILAAIQNSKRENINEQT